jgi:glycosyltransferase involved in cell wall biosynthesis
MLPPVSLVVVTYNEAGNIRECLASILALDYPRELLEIVVVDGSSDDGTPGIVSAMAEADPRIRLCDNPERTIASNRNMGIRLATSGLVAFTDADCVVPPGWLSLLVGSYLELKAARPAVCAVGGSNLPPARDQDGANTFLATLGMMLNSFAGSLGSVQGLRFKKLTRVRSLACLNVLYEKEAVLRAGLFDVGMGNIGEDADLNNRLRRMGRELYFVPGSFVYHRLRPTPARWAANMFHYGRGRALLIRKDAANMQSGVYLLPFLFLPVMLASPLGFVREFFFLPLAYFPVVVLLSLAVCLRERRPGLVLSLFSCYVITHFAYSLGIWAGLFGQRKKG